MIKMEICNIVGRLQKNSKIHIAIIGNLTHSQSVIFLGKFIKKKVLKSKLEKKSRSPVKNCFSTCITRALLNKRV